jgi:hypothetical protein
MNDDGVRTVTDNLTKTPVPVSDYEFRDAICMIVWRVDRSLREAKNAQLLQRGDDARQVNRDLKRDGTQPLNVFSVGWVHIYPQARQLNHWIVPTASPTSRCLLPQLLQSCCGGGRRAGCLAEVFGESIRRTDCAGNCRLSDVLFWTVGAPLRPKTNSSGSS